MHVCAYEYKLKANSKQPKGVERKSLTTFQPMDLRSLFCSIGKSICLFVCLCARECLIIFSCKVECFAFKVASFTEVAYSALLSTQPLGKWRSIPSWEISYSHVLLWVAAEWVKIILYIHVQIEKSVIFIKIFCLCLVVNFLYFFFFSIFNFKNL